MVIEGSLMALNEYLNACKGHWSRGRAIKREQQDIVSAYARKARLEPMDCPVEAAFSWIEPARAHGQLRDADNIAGAGMKFIFDALQECGVIPDDGPKVVRGFHHHFDYNDPDPRIEVMLTEYDPNGRTVRYKPVRGLD